MYSFTGSLLRDSAVLEAAQACIAEGKAPTYGYIAEKVADKFTDLGDDEVEAVNGFLDSARVKAPPVEDESLRNTWPPETVSMPVEQGSVSGIRTPGEPVEQGSVSTDTDPGESPAPMTREDVRLQMLDLQNRLNAARTAVVTLQQKLRDARGAAAVAITAYQNAFAPRSFESLIREHIASANAERAARAEGRIPPRPIKAGNSYFDRVGAYGAGDANTFVRKRMQRGGQRGAFPSTMRGRSVGVKA